jgi:hypothetical protein
MDRTVPDEGLMDVIEAIKIRKSCRTYSNRPVEPGTLSELRQFLASNTRAPFGSRLRFLLIDFDELEIAELKKLTTYGVIKGARQFIVGAVMKQPRAMEDFGYCMEKNVLKATSMGLGTCLLGGTFKRSGFSGKIDCGQGEVLPVITPVGVPGDRRSAVDRMFRWMAASDRRKPWQELFFLQDLESSLDKKESDRFETSLECVRLAPSASNKQPWRIVKDRSQDIFHLYLKRTPGYENLIKEVKLQNVDMGIAMCHFDLSAKERGFKGEWRVDDPGINTAGMEYIASWG